LIANGKNLSYTYDNNGIRTGKTVNDVTTNYFHDGSTIIAQQTGSNVLWFLYDSDGTRVGFTYNGISYFYTTDAQGDVTGLLMAKTPWLWNTAMTRGVSCST